MKMSDIRKVMIDDEIIELSEEKSQEIKLAIDEELSSDQASLAIMQKAKSDLLDKLGITAEEAALLLK